MLRFLQKIFFALCVLFAGPVQAKETIHVVADEWPPFSGANLPGGGISLDVIQTVLQKAGYDVRTEVLPWARIMSGARNGDYDVVGSLFYDAEIETFMRYSDPFCKTEVKFVKKSGTELTVEGLASLGQLSIAVGDGFLYEEEFNRSEALNKVVVTTTLQAMQMVGSGRVDLTLGSVDVLQHTLQTDAPQLVERVEILPYVLATHGLHMAIREDHPNRDEILADFNQTLQSMQEDGSLESLLQKHR